MTSRLSILIAALLWSTAGAAIKLSPLDGWQVNAGRSVVAGLMLFALFPLARRLPSLRVAGAGLAYAGTTVLFVLANKSTTAANAIFLQSSAPLYVLLLGPWLIGERPTKSALAAVPVFFGGLALFFVDDLQPGQLNGNLLALASGVSFGLTILSMRGLGDQAIAACAWGNAIAALLCLPVAATRGLPALSSLPLILYLGVFQLGLAYVFFVRGVKNTPALEASLLALLEPVLNPVWAFFLVGERPGPWALAGGAIILGGTLWQTLQPALSNLGRPASA